MQKNKQKQNKKQKKKKLLETWSNIDWGVRLFLLVANRRFRFSSVRRGRERSWTSPAPHCAARGTSQSSRRRRYEMAETASVTQSQGSSHVGTRSSLRHACDLLAWVGSGVCPEGKGIKTLFFFFFCPLKPPGCVSRAASLSDPSGAGECHLRPGLFLPRGPDGLVSMFGGTGAERCVSDGLSRLSETSSSSRTGPA